MAIDPNAPSTTCGTSPAHSPTARTDFDPVGTAAAAIASTPPPNAAPHGVAVDRAPEPTTPADAHSRRLQAADHRWWASGRRGRTHGISCFCAVWLSRRFQLVVKLYCAAWLRPSEEL